MISKLEENLWDIDIKKVGLSHSHQKACIHVMQHPDADVEVKERFTNCTCHTATVLVCTMMLLASWPIKSLTTHSVDNFKFDPQQDLPNGHVARLIDCRTDPSARPPALHRKEVYSFPPPAASVDRRPGNQPHSLDPSRSSMPFLAMRPT